MAEDAAPDAQVAVQSMVDAYNAHDIDALVSVLADDVVWHTTEGFIWPGPYRGRQAVRELFEHWWQGFDSGRADVCEHSEAGDAAMMSADVHGRSAGTGEDVHVQMNWVMHVRDGHVYLVRSYESAEEARAAL